MTTLPTWCGAYKTRLCYQSTINVISVKTFTTVDGFCPVLISQVFGYTIVLGQKLPIFLPRNQLSSYFEEASPESRRCEDTTRVNGLLNLDQSLLIFFAITSEDVLSLARIINVDEWVEGVDTLSGFSKVCNEVVCQSVCGIVQCASSPA